MSSSQIRMFEGGTPFPSKQDYLNPDLYKFTVIYLFTYHPGAIRFYFWCRSGPGIAMYFSQFQSVWVPYRSQIKMPQSVSFFNSHTGLTVSIQLHHVLHLTHKADLWPYACSVLVLYNAWTGARGIRARNPLTTSQLLMVLRQYTIHISHSLNQIPNIPKALLKIFFILTGLIV